MALAEDWRSCQWLTERERAMLEFAEKLTLTPYAITREDTDKLRAAGLDDEKILETTSICCQFNYMCRLVDALGAEIPEAARNPELDEELTSRGIVENPKAKVS